MKDDGEGEGGGEVSNEGDFMLLRGFDCQML